MKNTGWEMAYYVIVILLGFVAPRYIIQIYGSEVNGLSSTISQILSLLLLLEAGATTASVHSLFCPISENNIDEIREKLASATLYFKKLSYIFLLFMVVAAVITSLVIESDIEHIYIFLAFVMMGFKSFMGLYILSKYRIVFTAFEEKYLISMSTIVDQVIYYILVFVSLYFRFHFLTLFLWIAVSTMVRFWFLSQIFKKKHKELQNLDNTTGHVNVGNANTKYAMANEIAHTVASAMTGVVVSYLYGLKEASVISIYTLVFSALSLISSSLYSAFGPSFGVFFAKEGCQDSSKNVFRIFQYLFIMLNVFFVLCCTYLIIPFVVLYVGDVNDINYVNYDVAFLLCIVTLTSAFRIPYNIVVSSVGFFKETWKQPVICAVISVVMCIALGYLNYAYVFIGVVFFYICNFIYQHWRISRLAPGLISGRVSLMVLISFGGFILMAFFSFIQDINYTIWEFVGKALLIAIASFIYLLIMSLIFMKQELSLSYAYIKQLIKR